MTRPDLTRQERLLRALAVAVVLVLLAILVLVAVIASRAGAL